MVLLSLLLRRSSQLACSSSPFHSSSSLLSSASLLPSSLFQLSFSWPRRQLSPPSHLSSSQPRRISPSSLPPPSFLLPWPPSPPRASPFWQQPSSLSLLSSQWPWHSTLYLPPLPSSLPLYG